MSTRKIETGDYVRCRETRKLGKVHDVCADGTLVTVKHGAHLDVTVVYPREKLERAVYLL